MFTDVSTVLDSVRHCFVLHLLLLLQPLRVEFAPNQAHRAFRSQLPQYGTTWMESQYMYPSASPRGYATLPMLMNLVSNALLRSGSPHSVGRIETLLRTMPTISYDDGGRPTKSDLVTIRNTCGRLPRDTDAVMRLLRVYRSACPSWHVAVLLASDDHVDFPTTWLIHHHGASGTIEADDAHRRREIHRVRLAVVFFVCVCRWCRGAVYHLIQRFYFGARARVGIGSERMSFS